jgi:HTH-type transcriptional regulator/antitoxin HigA
MSNTRRVPAEVFPPGEFIREELEARDWTQADLAAILKKPLPAINEIILGKKAITPETAKSLGDAFGTGAEFWMNLETSYRLAMSSPSDSDVAKRAQLYSAAPIKDIVKRGWISWSDDTDELQESLFKFFRASSIEDIQDRRMAARKSTSYGKTSIGEWAWRCRALQMAESVSVAKYSEDALRTDGLDAIRRLTESPEEIRKVPKILADFGVRFVIVERLPKTEIDGVALWLGDSPAIAMSMRYDRIDSFWFTLAHELKHVLDGGESPIDTRLVGKDRQPTEEKPQEEKDADHFAAQFLVPSEEIESFIRRVRPLYSKVRINQFANRIGVHPGIVIGQLQHRQEIGWMHSREMLVKVLDTVTSTAFTDGWGSEPEQE